MGASFLITLREGLEMALVVAIVLAYLRGTGRRELFRPVWAGTALAMVVSLVAGIAFYNFAGDFEGRTEQFVEGVLALSAAGVLTWMIFWMRSHARGISRELQQKVDAAASRSTAAIAAVAFVAVAREGFETALFLVGAEVNGSSGARIVIGGIIGLAVAAVIGYFVYEGGHRIDLRRFFTVTGALLILFAAGLFAKGIHEFREFFEIEGSLANSAWDVTSGPLARGWFNDFLAGMFGWAPNAEVLRVVAYFAYLIPVAYLFFAGARRPRTSTAPTAPATASATAS